MLELELESPAVSKHLTSKEKKQEKKKQTQIQTHYKRRLTLNLAQARADHLEWDTDRSAITEATTEEEIDAQFEAENKHLTAIEDGGQKEVLAELHYSIGFAKRLIKSEELLFYVKRVAREIFVVKCTPKAKTFIATMKMTRFIQCNFFFQRLNPYFNLLWQCADQYQLELNSEQLFASHEHALERASRLNSLAEMIRQKGRSKKFTTECKKFHRSSNKNHQELLKYVRRHSNQTGRLLICRCDVGVKKVAAFHQYNNNEKFQAFHDAREQLFEFIGKTFGENFIGFAWKLEFGLRRGFHYHLMFIFNGRNLKSDIPIVRMIGEHWRQEVMGGAGTYYNCNAYKESYQSCGIGPYSKEVNPEKWKGIELMCAYLTKPDDLARLQIEGMRTFGKGNMPEE